MDKMKLSIIIPVYNEAKTIREVIERVKNISISSKEIIVVDDCSVDGTRESLNRMGENGVAVYFHQSNIGKGASIQTALHHISGDVVVIQDGDLELDPNDIEKMFDIFVKNGLDVLYGSRLLAWRYEHNIYYVANQIFALITNLIFKSCVSDIMTGYKMCKASLLRDLQLKSNGFEIEPEITAKILKRNIRIIETPVAYHPRTYAEGKKIRKRDALKIIWALFRYRYFK